MIKYLADELPLIFGRTVTPLPSIPVPPQSYDSQRQQCLSSEILKTILESASTDDNKILGITEVDLFIPIFTYIFGEAQLDGRAGLISLARLKPQLYDEPPDDAPSPCVQELGELYKLRALKEAVHELGHTFGLKHCPEPNCVMRFANNIGEVDSKEYTFCPSCRDLIIATKARRHQE